MGGHLPSGRTCTWLACQSMAAVFASYIRGPTAKTRAALLGAATGVHLFDQEQPGGGMSVMRIPAEGGPPSLVFASRSMQRWSFDLSPDGLHLAFGSSERSYGELWALDNVLSTLK